jgi:hypothetical protein
MSAAGGIYSLSFFCCACAGTCSHTGGHSYCDVHASKPQQFNVGLSFPGRTPYRCPVCVGTGLVSRPPGVAGDQDEWTSSNAGPYPCRPCLGSGILWS